MPPCNVSSIVCRALANGGLTYAFFYESKGDGGGRRALTGPQPGASLSTFLPAGNIELTVVVKDRFGVSAVASVSVTVGSFSAARRRGRLLLAAAAAAATEEEEAGYFNFNEMHPMDAGSLTASSSRSLYSYSSSSTATVAAVAAVVPWNQHSRSRSLLAAVSPTITSAMVGPGTYCLPRHPKT